MDSAVSLVQTYLRVNGYFTVTEGPVHEGRTPPSTSIGLARTHPRAEPPTNAVGSAGLRLSPYVDPDEPEV